MLAVCRYTFPCKWQFTRCDAKVHRPGGDYHILPQVEEVSFQAPVSIGDLLRFQSHVAHTARRPDDPTLVCNDGNTAFTCPQKHQTFTQTPAGMQSTPSMLQGRVHVEVVASVMKPEVASSKVRVPLEEMSVCDLEC